VQPWIYASPAGGIISALRILGNITTFVQPPLGIRALHKYLSGVFPKPTLWVFYEYPIRITFAQWQ
jgi:hypothetical protein